MNREPHIINLQKKKLKQFPNTISVFHRIWALYHSSTINIMSITYDSTGLQCTDTRAPAANA